MRATIEGILVEGTPEEVAALIRAQRDEHRTPMASNDVSPSDSDSDEDDRFASERVAYRALRRRPLSSAQRSLFRTLAGAYPSWVSASELQAVTGYSGNQLGGLLGAIGRRLSETSGYVLGSTMIEGMWEADQNEIVYRLPPTVFPAVQRIDP